MEELSRSDWTVGICMLRLIVNLCGRAPIIMGNTIPKQMVLDCIRKAAKYEFATASANTYLQVPISKFLLEFLL